MEYKMNGLGAWHEIIIEDKDIDEFTFCNYKIKIYDTIFEKNDENFRKSYEQEKAWEMLK